MKPVAHSVPSLLGHIRAPFDQQIPWYPNVREYTRRELFADAIVHGLGLLLGAAAFAATIIGWVRQYMSVWQHTSDPPYLVAFSVCIYGGSLLAMLICSAAFNVGQRVWHLHTDTLALLDHVGICLLIAGSASPIFIFSCAWKSSAVLWFVMLLNIFAKAVGGCLDNIALHVVAFVLGPFMCYRYAIESVRDTLAPWQLNMITVAGVFYIGGLLPWGIRQLEFHVAIWHICVLIGCGALAELTELTLADPCLRLTSTLPAHSPGAIFFDVYFMVDTPAKVALLEQRLHECLGWY